MALSRRSSNHAVLHSAVWSRAGAVQILQEQDKILFLVGSELAGLRDSGLHERPDDLAPGIPDWIVEAPPVAEGGDEGKAAPALAIWGGRGEHGRGHGGVPGQQQDAAPVAEHPKAHGVWAVVCLRGENRVGQQLRGDKDDRISQVGAGPPFVQDGAHVGAAARGRGIQGSKL